MDGLLRDVRVALRSLARQRAFLLTVVLTLAVGIGANSAVFSMVDALLLRALPWPDAGRLVLLSSTAEMKSGNLADWHSALPAFDRMEGSGLGSAALTGAGPAREVEVSPVSAGFLSLLGAKPAMGRLLDGANEQPGAAPVAVVSARLWHDVLGGGPSLTNRSIVLDGIAYGVVGVLPGGFALPAGDAEVWLPFSGPDVAVNPLARLAPGASLESAKREAQAAAASRPVADWAPPGTKPASYLQSLRESETRQLRLPLLIALAAAVLVMAMACVNVATLLLARGSARTGELMLRAALGARRGVLLRQLLVESLVTGLPAGALGLLTGWWGTHALLRFAPPWMDQLRAVRLDPLVIGFTLALSLVTVLAAGLGPALSALRGASGMAAGAQTRVSASRGAQRGREFLIGGEIALALVVLVAMVLLLRTFLTLQPRAPGFSAENRLVAEVRVPAAGDATRAATNYAQRLLQRLAVQPGVRVAAIATTVPFTGLTGTVQVLSVDGQPLAPGGSARFQYRAITQGYQETLGMRIVQGRGFGPADGPGGAPVLVLNESAARRLLGGTAEAPGHRITLAMGRSPREFTVVGVINDARSLGMTDAVSAEVLTSFWQAPQARFNLVMHTRDGGLNEAQLRRLAAEIDPDIPLAAVTTLSDITARAVAQPRFHLVLMLGISALGVLLALVGCYSLLAFTVTQRRREFGVRAALGATRRDLARHVLGRGLRFIGAGVAVGVALAWASTRLLVSLLFGVAPTDPASFALAAAALCLTAACAALLPALRAAGVNPVEALRGHS